MFSDCSSDSPFKKWCPAHTLCHLELSRCVPDVGWQRPANATCSSNMDCSVSEYCYQKNNTCLPRARVAQPCDTDQLNGTPCMNHHACIANVCLAPCSNDHDCQFVPNSHFLDTNYFCHTQLNGYCVHTSNYARNNANLALILPLVFGVLILAGVVSFFSYRVWKKQRQARVSLEEKFGSKPAEDAPSNSHAVTCAHPSSSSSTTLPLNNTLTECIISSAPLVSYNPMTFASDKTMNDLGNHNHNHNHNNYHNSNNDSSSSDDVASSMDAKDSNFFQRD